jgi:hypothetical protein
MSRSLSLFVRWHCLPPVVQPKKPHLEMTNVQLTKYDTQYPALSYVVIQAKCRDIQSQENQVLSEGIKIEFALKPIIPSTAFRGS